MILQDVGRPFDNATLERVRHIDTTVRRSPSKHSPMPAAAAARMMEAVEESAESLLDVSDMSFDETGDLLGDSRRHMNVTGANKRRSSHR